MSEPKPSVGRIVHFMSLDGSCRAAIITEVEDDTHVTLTVFGSGAPMGGVTATLGADTPHLQPLAIWHWPERV